MLRNCFAAFAFVVALVVAGIAIIEGHHIAAIFIALAGVNAAAFIVAPVVRNNLSFQYNLAIAAALAVWGVVLFSTV